MSKLYQITVYATEKDLFDFIESIADEDWESVHGHNLMTSFIESVEKGQFFEFFPAMANVKT